MYAILKSLGFLVSYFALSMPAYAYLDPVTGSLVIQGLIALLASVLASVKSVRLKILALVSFFFKRKDS